MILTIPDILQATLTPSGRVNSRVSQLINLGERPELLQSIVALTSFLEDGTPIAQRLWHIMNNVFAPCVCQQCGDKVKFVRTTVGYQPFCGVSCATSAPSRNEKTKNTLMVKYGVTNPGLIPSAIEKRAATNIAKYGVEFPLQAQSILAATHVTQQARHGGWGFGSESIRASADSSRLELHGTKQGNFLSSAHITGDQYKLMENANLLLGWHTVDCLTVGEIAANIGVSRSTMLKRFDDHGIAVKLHYKSSLERLVASWLVELGVEFEANDRRLLKPQELDIVIPSHSIAIEINGLWYHSERNGFDPDRHLQKTIRCQKLGYRLIHLYDYELLTNPSKCKSLIQSSVGRTTSTGARKLTVTQLSSQQQRDFFNTNHMQGCGTVAPICFGLCEGAEILAAMSFGQSRYDKTAEYELMRYATKLHVTVTGGASKLFKHFVAQYTPASIVSYCDRRLFVGGVYTQLGFTKMHSSKPSHWYFKSPVTKLYHRSAFQKHMLQKKLAHYDPSITAWANMVANGWNRVWDCGTTVYKWQAE